ncbi:N-acetylmuramoyl-L-alanine amidase [Loigolactobacillus zhaoyuanensis]|uniref:N-acetylmuramoyl-L-alanine amidase n=1 Tax=Loigolactobacillus zhaoyuanensis TaxID=2486017 RepID=UPI0013DE3841|nr:N-acetylmuramoyl-L-alanine amidase [Loigolactobacillus zhaoyuanensis]
MKKLNKVKLLLGATATAAALLFGATVPASAYTVNNTYAFGASQGSSQVANNKYIVLHDVGAESGAAANANYFDNNWNTAYTYAHYTVGDGGQVFKIGEPGYVAWAAGDYANANSPVQIELGHTNSYTQFKQDYAAYVALAHDSAVQFNIPLRYNNVASGIITHRFVTDNWWGDHTDPLGYLAKWGVSEATLAHDVVTGVSSLGGSSNVINNPSKPATSAPAASSNSGKMANGFTAESGTFVNGDTPIQVRYRAGVDAPRAGVLPAGAAIKYDSYINFDGYVWVHYTGYNGRDLYLPTHPSGTANNVWGTFK